MTLGRCFVKVLWCSDMREHDSKIQTSFSRPLHLVQWVASIPKVPQDRCRIPLLPLAPVIVPRHLAAMPPTPRLSLAPASGGPTVAASRTAFLPASISSILSPSPLPRTHCRNTLSGLINQQRESEQRSLRRRSCPCDWQPLLDNLPQCRHACRFCQAVIHPGKFAGFQIFRHGICRDGNDGNIGIAAVC